MSKVFVSHKGLDDDIARRVARRVEARGLSVYLDSVDPALGKDGYQLADYLLKRMDECQQLIAVVSSATALSWWVPWEIGVGSEKGFRMASFLEEPVALPTYLQKWPSLRTMREVDMFCALSKTVNAKIQNTTKSLTEESEKLSIRRDNAAQFHRELALNLRIDRELRG